MLTYNFLGFEQFGDSYESYPITALVARDLGSPCPHSVMICRKIHRYWGLCIQTSNATASVTGFTDEYSWYDDETQKRIKSLAVANPDLGKEFLQRVIYDDDWDYWHRFSNELLDGKGIKGGEAE